VRLSSGGGSVDGVNGCWSVASSILVMLFKNIPMPNHERRKDGETAEFVGCWTIIPGLRVLCQCEELAVSRYQWRLQVIVPGVGMDVCVGVKCVCDD
jgi:hypothetical protein